ncbi:KIF13B, partial [Symbiodinium sp. KB8]
ALIGLGAGKGTAAADVLGFDPLAHITSPEDIAALENKSLEEALIGLGAGQGTAAGDVRQRIEKQLIAALEDGSLEEAIQTSLAPSPPPVVPAPVASAPRADPKTVEEFSAKMFLEAFSEKGRRLDTLMRSIAEAEAQIKQREQRCQQLQAHVSQHKLELAHLDLDFEWCSKLLDSAEARRGDLQAAQRKLLGTLHGKMYELADVTTTPLTSRAVEGSRSPRVPNPSASCLR